MSDAWSMAEAVRRGDTTCLELVESALERIKQLDGQVNAFTVVTEDAAVDAARAADRLRASTPTDRLPPLLGVPVSVKDHIWLAGVAATNGSVALRHFVPDVDAVPVARLKAAGAIVVGKTNNPEFCYPGYTDNDLWGLTRNPWSLDRTPGGSSGGAGASVAYGATPIAIGADGGGSIRTPAAFCGIVGHKPTFGLVPKMPGFRGWFTLSVDGPLTRTVRDAALTLSVIAGPSPHDDLTWPGDPGDLLASVTEPVDWGSLRIAVSDDLGWGRVERSVRAAFRDAVDKLAADGAVVEEATPDTPYPGGLWDEVALPEGFASEGPLLAEWGDQLTPGTREIIEAGRTSAQEYIDAQQRRSEYAGRWATFFEDYDLLLTPTMPLPAFATGITAPATIDGVVLDPLCDDWEAMALPANLTGSPACSVPTGWDADGLPLGMQVMGSRWSDARVLAVAAAYERLAPWADRWPPLVERAVSS